MCGGFSATLLCIMLMLQATYSTLFGTMQIARVSIIIIIWQIYDDDDDVLAEIDAAYAEFCYQRDHFCKVNFWWFPHRIFDRFLSSGRHVSLSSLALCMCASQLSIAFAHHCWWVLVELSFHCISAKLRI